MTTADELRRAAQTLHDTFPTSPTETLLNVAAEVYEQDETNGHARSMAAAAHELARQININAGKR